MSTRPYRLKLALFLVVSVGLFAGWRHLQSEAGLRQMDGALRANKALGVPRCAQQTMDAFADQWANIPGFDRERIALGLMNYCGPLLPWTQYRIVDTPTRRTLATVSRSSGVELR